MPEILKSFQFKFKSLNIFTDSQIALSWVLAGESKNKQLFIKNRIQDIQKMVEKLKSEFDLKPKFRFVNTLDNVADLVSRPTSFKDFEKKLHFFKHGPEWLAKDSEFWPKSDLKCLNDECKAMLNICNFQVINTDIQNKP